MKDFIESKESCAEKRYDEIYIGNGKMKCDCGELFDEDEGMVLSQDPWAMPSCPKCCDEFFNHHTQKDGIN